MRHVLSLARKDDPRAPECMVGPLELKFSNPEAEDGVFEGYASLFNKVDAVNDMVRPGAFKNSLAKRGASQVKMLYQHSSWDPIGVWDEIKEDDKGLYVKGHLLLEIQRAKEAYVLMKAKQLSGLSIGYRTLNADFTKEGIRHLVEVDLFEISPVTFPCLVNAGVTSVKTESILSDPRAMEQAYRDGGLSAASAKIAVAVTKKFLAPREVERPDQAHREGVKAAVTTIRKATALFGK